MRQMDDCLRTVTACTSAGGGMDGAQGDGHRLQVCMQVLQARHTAHVKSDRSVRGMRTLF